MYALLVQLLIQISRICFSSLDRSVPFLSPLKVQTPVASSHTAFLSPTLDITNTKVVSSLPWEHSRNTGKRKSRSVLKDFLSIVDNGADIEELWQMLKTYSFKSVI